MIKTVLIDIRNAAVEIPKAIAAIGAASLVGLDLETHDDDRHEGLNKLGKYDEETRKKGGNTKLIFDTRRTTIAGFSVYPDGGDTAWYVNLAHADVGNRVPWEAAQYLLRARKSDAHWIAHNAKFEITMLANSLGFELNNVICTLQMAVSAYGPDEYDFNKMKRADLGELGKFIPALHRLSISYDATEDRELKGELAELASKITAKESTAAHSYNGWVNDLSWGYGLKKAVKTHFGHDMATFEDTLGDNGHMGQLTGEQVAAYGAEDAVWAVKLFHRLLAYMTKSCPKAVDTFFKQENPMVPIYADMWRGGLRVDLKKIEEKRDEERKLFGQHLRELKAAIRKAFPFRPEPDPRLMKWEKWYDKNYTKYRAKILEWAATDDSADPFTQCMQVRSPVSNAWADELKVPQSEGVNLVHYMPMRTILYDLLMLPLEFSMGKVQSDGESRGNLRIKAAKADSIEDDTSTLSGWKAKAGVAIEVLDCLNRMAGCEQRMKLYLTPYMYMTDPETNRLYPDVSSQLATRRMAASNPNPMQLAKRGESTYVRGFFLADDSEHVVFSRDWSGIELLIVGEFSKDPEFKVVFGQLPHGDLHSGAAADILSVEVPGLSETAFKSLKKSESWEQWLHNYRTTIDEERLPRLQRNLKGENMKTADAFKYWRTEIGKGANFNYWFSGWLATIGERMGWDQETTAEATRRYAERFIVAETWRRGAIDDVCNQGWVELPDGHRRYRMEATNQWLTQWLLKWRLDDDEHPMKGYNGVIREISRRIQKRAHNQAVNALVQGTCATLAKRSILQLNAEMKKLGWTNREARLMIPIHDELLYSVHRDRIHDFMDLTSRVMNSHKDLFPTLAVDSSPAIGLNFEPWGRDKAPFGQIELYEPPSEIVGDKLAGERLDRDGVNQVIDYLFHKRMKMAA